MSMPYFTMDGPKPLHGVLKWEGPPEISRENVTLLAGSGAAREVRMGMLAGKRLLGAISITNGTNTGNGAVGSAVRGRKCKIGSYVLTCIAAASNAGIFAVVDPDGLRLADATVGVAFTSPQIGFTVADGGTDFVVGDRFTLAVAEGDKKVTQIDFSATDGSQIAAGMFIGDYFAPDGTDAQAVITKADARLALAEIVWPSGATSDQKSAALSDLAARRITTSQGG